MVRAFAQRAQGPDCRDWKSSPRLRCGPLTADIPPRKLAQGLLLSARFVAETTAISVPTVLESMRGTLTPAATDRRLERWAARVLRGAGVELEVEGTVPTEGGPFVVMSNHSSFLDIPVVYRLFGGRLRMVAKKELFAVPVFGRAMQEAGFVRVDRQDRGQAIRSFDAARAQMQTGTSIWIAPEGTRGDGTKLGPLKKGGFLLALQTGCAILPLTLRGTQRILPRGAFALRPAQPVQVIVHAPIPVHDLPIGTEAELRQSRDRLIERVAACIGGAL